MVVSELVALLGVKTDAASFEKANGALGKLASVAKVAIGLFAGAKVVGWVTGIFNEVQQVADELDRVSARTGIATDTLQKLGHAAFMSDIDVGTMEFSLRRLQVELSKAGTGKGDAAKTFKHLGLSVKNADGSLKSVDQMLPTIADKIVGMKTDTERTAFAVQMFGRSGTMLLPLLKKGSAGIAELTAEAEALGIVMNEQTIKGFTDYEDGQKRILSLYKGWKQTIATALLPAFTAIQKRFLDWMKLNREWVSLKLGVVFQKIGQVIDHVASAIWGIGSAIVNGFAGLEKIAPEFMKIMAIVMGIAAILLLPGGSIILLGLLVMAIIDDFKTWQEGGVSLTGTLIKGFNDILGIDLVKFFKGVAGAAREAFEYILSAVQFVVEAMSDMGTMKAAERFVRRNTMISGEQNTSPNENAATYLQNIPTNAETMERLRGLRNPGKGLGKGAFTPEIIQGIIGMSLPTNGSRVPYEAQFSPATARSVGLAPPLSVTPINTVTVTVNATTGADANTIGAEVAKQVQTSMDDSYRNALQALSPAPMSIPGGG